MREGRNKMKDLILTLTDKKTQSNAIVSGRILVLDDIDTRVQITIVPQELQAQFPDMIKGEMYPLSTIYNSLIKLAKGTDDYALTLEVRKN